MPQSKIVNIGNALSYAYPVEGSTDLLLLNLEESRSIKNEYYEMISEDLLIQNNVAAGQNFFYLLKCFDTYKYGRKLLKTESGVGEVKKVKNKYYLVREQGISLTTERGEFKLQGSVHRFQPGNYIECTAFIPKSYLDLFVYPFSVMCSIDAGIPTPVELQENTLLGRLDDQIQSIDSNELRAILGDQNIIDAIESTLKPLSLQSKVVDLVSDDSRLTASALNARPRNKKTARKQRGSIIYDDQTNCFYGYDGTNWRPLKWGDE